MAKLSIQLNMVKYGPNWFCSCFSAFWLAVYISL